MIGSRQLTTFVALLLIGFIYSTSSVSGSTNQGCNQTELTTIRQCFSTYNTQFTSYFGTGGTCNRTLITQQACSSYATIVTCVNNASLSISTCRPYVVSQIDSDLGISCKVNDFVVTCSSAPQLNEGTKSGASCLSSVGVHVIFVAMVILAVIACPVKNS